MIHDELNGLVSALCAKFPGRSRDEIETVVFDVYEQLAMGATITAHLIPLTLNRSRRLLSGMPVSENSRDAALSQSCA